MKAKRKPSTGPARPEDISEQCLHLHTKQFLDKAGLFNKLLIFHVPNGEKRDARTAVKLKRMGVRPGVADWLLFTPKGAVAIELKDAEGEQQPSQLVFQRQWEACGHEYVIVRSLEEFVAVVRRYAP